MGNLLTETSENKATKYAYNSQNRMIYCEVIDKAEKEYAQTTYSYDAFGRRILVQDKGEAALRTLYDGLSFDVIKQSPTFENGLFTDSNNNGIRWGKTGKPTGDRYRYISDEDSADGNRYFYLDENTYKTRNTRYRGERTQISVNGSISAQSTLDYGTDYFSTDLLGSVRTTTDGYGSTKSTASYDAFGSLVQGDLQGTIDFGYLGKNYESTTNLYNYGYRDYNSLVTRFTTSDPIRDGKNWFIYCNADPINYVDLLGLSPSDKDSKLFDTDVFPGWINGVQCGWNDNALQTKAGYHDWMDKASVALFNIDSAEIDMGDYSIRFWKGDYGATARYVMPLIGMAGGEVGFYNNDGKGLGSDGGSLMTQDDLKNLGITNIQLTVKNKNGKSIGSVEGERAWPNVYNIADYSKKEDLYTETKLSFETNELASSFVNHFSLNIEGGLFSNQFTKPIVNGNDAIIIWGKNK